ncbi:transposase [Microvirga pakistanensis]|uniref:transposase n=1 Tax=Microvirga pakistanensis TaxID=1682650 RepID=UPI002452E5EB|nr:transposase [Microvirga pakistanensis]
MPKKRFSSEQIIAKLRQIEVQLAQGKSIALVCKEAGISEQSYHRWRKELRPPAEKVGSSAK